MSEMTESATAEVPPLTLGWRLQMAMAHGGQTRQSMAEALGVGISTITRWTSDKGTPKKAYIAQWGWLTRVPVEWLETGTAPIQPDPGVDVTTDRYPPVAAVVIGITGLADRCHEIRDSHDEDVLPCPVPATAVVRRAA